MPRLFAIATLLHILLGPTDVVAVDGGLDRRKNGATENIVKKSAHKTMQRRQHRRQHQADIG